MNMNEANEARHLLWMDGPGAASHAISASTTILVLFTYLDLPRVYMIYGCIFSCRLAKEHKFLSVAVKNIQNRRFMSLIVGSLVWQRLPN